MCTYCCSGYIFEYLLTNETKRVNRDCLTVKQKQITGIDLSLFGSSTDFTVGILICIYHIIFRKLTLLSAKHCGSISNPEIDCLTVKQKQI
jgi:hypothetical protein